MKVDRKYIDVLKHLGCGADVYDGTLAQCVKEHKIKDGRVVAIISGKEIDLLPILPTVRVLNKCVELILKNATIAITGIWQAEDDGVLNIDNVRIAPGAIIPKAVGSKGLTELKSTRQFNITNDMVSDLRAQIKDYFRTGGVDEYLA